uniref:Uncharacterized protein n=1 Tax=Anguilla anguilla TaxID=7936 RepID=A0A0E9UWQ7_ANGAN
MPVLTKFFSDRKIVFFIEVAMKPCFPCQTHSFTVLRRTKITDRLL